MRLTAWIVNYNSAALLDECVASLPDDVARVLVWDNASPSPGEHDRLERVATRDSRVEIHLGTENLGFGAAMNRLAALDDSAPHDLVWLLNPDTELRSGSVGRTTAALADGTADVVTPAVVWRGPQGEGVWFDGGDFNLRRGHVRHWDVSRPFAVRDAFRETRFMSGAAPMMTRATWDRLGGLRDDLFLYWEDVDMSVRAAELGVRMVVDEGTLLFHHQSASSRSGAGLGWVFYFYRNRNRVVVAGDRVGRWNVVLGSGLLWTLRAVAQPLVRERGSRVRSTAAVIRGTWDGLRAKRSQPRPVGEDRGAGSPAPRLGEPEGTVHRW